MDAEQPAVAPAPIERLALVWIARSVQAGIASCWVLLISLQVRAYRVLGHSPRNSRSDSPEALGMALHYELAQYGVMLAFFCCLVGVVAAPVGLLAESREDRLTLWRTAAVALLSCGLAWATGLTSWLSD
ncbi:MAG: hypothetical protein OXT09_22660 [Myxococcales bacterium]|nr:hypothetical protein [Myxococcales bacterium]